MANTIHIPTPLRPFTDKKESVQVTGATVGELLADLTKQYDGLRKHLYADDGKLRNFVNIYLNDEDIRYLQREQTPVKAGDALGIGRIGIVDFDVVDFSNLQRQLLHGTKDVGRTKNESAKSRITDLNPHVQVDTYETALSSQNALDLFKDYDVILDGTDNFPTRYLVNDACVLSGKPNAYGSIFRFEGQASVFGVKEGPCYRCLYPEPPPPGLVPSCAEGGVLGVLPGIIGVIQATETVKLILGIGEPLIGRFMIYDALKMRFRELKLRKDAECPVCGTNPTVTKLIDYEQFCGVRPQPQEAQTSGAAVNELEITPVELKKK